MIEVTVSGQIADAYQALCDGSAAVVSLDAFSYLAASQAGCGEALYQTVVDGDVATQGQLVAAAGKVFNLNNFRSRVFCRTDALSVSGWIMPELAMQANGIDPFTDLKDVINAGSDAEVLNDIVAGRCEVGATAAGAEQQLSDPSRIDVIQVLDPVPTDVVAVSSGLSSDLRAQLVDLLNQHETEIASLVGADSLQDPDDAAFTALQTLLDQAGVDLNALSQ